MTHKNAIISIQNVSKKFGSVNALRDINIDIYEKEFFALIGPSGCGKTTLLRILAGFESPTTGKVFLDGQDMNQVPPNKRPTNMVFQSYAVFPHMTVRKNIEYGLRFEKIDKEERQSKVEEILKQIQMESFAERMPDQLSGGQRQRVALARALIKRPQVLLLDEPLSALDAQLRYNMQVELVTLQKTVGITFIVVTHDQEEAMSLSTRMAILNEGEVYQIDTPTSIYEKPANKFVADFTGSANIFEVVSSDINPEKQHITIKNLEHFPIVFNGDAILEKNNIPFYIAVRPEKVVLSEKEIFSNKYWQMSGVIVSFTYKGSSTIYFVRVGTTIFYSFLVNVEKQKHLKINNTVFIQIFLGDIILLTS